MNLKTKNNIMDFAGSWNEIKEEEIEEIKDKIKELRKRSTRELMTNIGKIR